MSHLTAVSFDADAIRVVTVNRTRGGLCFDHACPLTEDEFTAFLQHDTSSAYFLVINPTDALYETISIPPVESKYTERIVRAELQRLHADITDFTVAYRIIGDSIQEGRTIRRVACCIIPLELLHALLTPFINHNKTVRQIVATPWLLARLASEGYTELPDTLLCAYDEGERKTLLVQEHGAVLFTRQVPSEGRGWNTFDRQNVTMTLDYCFQSLRIRPGGAIAINSEDPPPPFFPFDLPVLPGFSADALIKYPAQIASFIYPLNATEDLRPAAYCKALREQHMIRTVGKGFAFATALLMLLILLKTYQLITLTRSLNAMKPSPPLLQEVLTNYKVASEKKTAMEQFITLHNNQLIELSIPRFLASLKLAQLQNVNVQTLTIKRNQDVILLTMGGIVRSRSLSDAQTHFEELNKRLTAAPGLQIETKTLDPIRGNFTLEARYTP